MVTVMGICPNCGDWVDEGDICMSCGGASAGRADDIYGSYVSSGHVYQPSPESIKQRRKRDLKRQCENYEASINAARNENNDNSRRKHYGDALEHVGKYSRLSESYGMSPCDMPNMKHALSDADVEWLGQRHYESQHKLALFGNDEKDELEDILKRSGNEMVIRQNKSRYDALRRANAQRREIEDTKQLRRDYFEHVKKANAAVDDGKIKRAMKEYRKADYCWCEYFKRNYRKDSNSEEMPENKFFDDAVDHMMVIYLKTHPILTSKKKHLKIHSEILEMLDGKWDGRIAEADRRAQEVLDEKHRKRQELFNKAGDVIVGARIVGDKIFQRLGR
ncbi:hypothetical protein [Methanobrevibacter sp. UBA212]|uniref:hypothetical protein n=1 Tax=Methanobrevibacter sp. UBA212 TaxID=1915476 RepID=UPI0025F1C620|nr:hypothetical protein [Methanobrevibacter sp. UBA212]